MNTDGGGSNGSSYKHPPKRCRSADRQRNLQWEAWGAWHDRRPAQVRTLWKLPRCVCSRSTLPPRAQLLCEEAVQYEASDRVRSFRCRDITASLSGCSRSNEYGSTPSPASSSTLACSKMRCACCSLSRAPSSSPPAGTSLPICQASRWDSLSDWHERTGIS